VGCGEEGLRRAPRGDKFERGYESLRACQERLRAKEPCLKRGFFPSMKPSSLQWKRWKKPPKRSPENPFRDRSREETRGPFVVLVVVVVAGVVCRILVGKPLNLDALWDPWPRHHQRASHQRPSHHSDGPRVFHRLHSACLLSPPSSPRWALSGARKKVVASGQWAATWGGGRICGSPPARSRTWRVGFA